MERVIEKKQKLTFCFHQPSLFSGRVKSVQKQKKVYLKNSLHFFVDMKTSLHKSEFLLLCINEKSIIKMFFFIRTLFISLSSAT